MDQNRVTTDPSPPTSQLPVSPTPRRNGKVVFYALCLFGTCTVCSFGTIIGLGVLRALGFHF